MATVPGQGGRRSYVFAVVFLGFLGVAPALAGDANQVTLSISGRDSQYSFIGSYLYSLAGDTSKEGMIVRAAVGGDDDDDNSSSTNAEFLVGYHYVSGDWRLRALGGLAYVSADDAEKFGIKVQLQAYTKKSAELYVNTTFSYNSAKQNAAANVQVGGQIGNDLVLGPEAGLSVGDTNTRGRLGLFLTGIQLGDIGLSVRGGYTVNENNSDTEGSYYYGASATYRF